jgi:cell division protein FtsB|tara:strand:- start:1237 stop:1605 length:369 start_codon:yes stop_codon:yes gene_type:complete
MQSKNSAATKQSSRRGQSAVSLLIWFIAALLITQTLIGEDGLLESQDVTHTYRNLSESVRKLRYENVQLRAYVRRLQKNPEAIAAIAREEFGLIHPSEILVIPRNPSLNTSHELEMLNNDRQ